jgi:hypothetical protein
VWGRELSVDATKVEANAGIPSPSPASRAQDPWAKWASSRCSKGLDPETGDIFNRC